MNIQAILDDPVSSFLLTTNGELNDIVIGVPHHSPLGRSELPCIEHKEADENTGLLGYYIACLLNCHCIIACNYFIDSNKSKGSDYFKKIHSLMPKILVEIHGHGGKSAKFDIEISSGARQRNNWSQDIASRLANKLKLLPLLQEYTISGDFQAIHFKALKSVSITTTEWIAFHIELPKSIRESKSKYFLFCESLAEVLKELLSEFDKLKEGEM